MQLEYISAFLITLVVTLLVMPGVIRFLHEIKFGQTEREEGLASHKVKNGTPTMGGIVFILVPLIVFALMRPSALREAQRVDRHARVCRLWADRIHR